jgi:phosphoribosyl-ATP pyrophosphohydrolase/phosphoribosyl-AMP cyclohydrolase
MMSIDIHAIQFHKLNGLVPVCVQDANSLAILMVGFMNPEALKATLETQRVTFYSRSKGRLWTKGESSGHYLDVVDIALDCDNDSLLILATPQGATCHVGNWSCFRTNENVPSLGQCLSDLMQLFPKRLGAADSYTQQLLTQGISRIAQKVGEEGVEVALAAVSGVRDDMITEVADLLYHLLVLLFAANISLNDIAAELHNRSKP